MNANSGLPMSQTSLSGEVTEKLHVGGGGIVDAMKFTRESMNHSPRSFSNVHIQPVLAPFFTGNKILSDTTSHESSLFSSSLSEMFSQKCKILFHANLLLSRMCHGKRCKLSSSTWTPFYVLLKLFCCNGLPVLSSERASYLATVFLNVLGSAYLPFSFQPLTTVFKMSSILFF